MRLCSRSRGNHGCLGSAGSLPDRIPDAGGGPSGVEHTSGPGPVVAMSEARPGPSSGARRVFISSTNEDLKPHYRAAARDAALEAGFYPTMQEYFVASGEHPPLAACLKKLADADVIVVIVA